MSKNSFILQVDFSYFLIQSVLVFTNGVFKKIVLESTESVANKLRVCNTNRNKAICCVSSADLYVGVFDYCTVGFLLMLSGMDCFSRLKMGIRSGGTKETLNG